MFVILNDEFESPDRRKMKRLPFEVFNLEDPAVFDKFAHGEPRTVSVPGTDQIIAYDALPRTGVARSNLDTSLAISLGAYVYALQKFQNSNSE
jgi:glucokinase